MSDAALPNDADVHKSKPSHHNNKKGLPSDNERQKETSKAAQQALAARKEAQRLRQAANDTDDPRERERLMKESMNKEMEAQSYGKAAKYLQSGAFQGLVAGAGIGTVPGLAVGTITGTVVGGATSLVTGGLGAVIGVTTGALHGPFVGLGKLAGKGMQSVQAVTGMLPGLKGSAEQKALEVMMAQMSAQEAPSEADLMSMVGGEAQTQGSETVPQLSGTMVDSLRQASVLPDTAGAQPQRPSGDSVDAPGAREQPAAKSQHASLPQSRKPPPKLNGTAKSQQVSSPRSRKPPRKLEIRKTNVE